MACGCGCGRPQHFTDLSGLDLSKTLARQLICVADGLRDIRTQFGMRPYEVHVKRAKWSGGQRGLGEPYVVSDMTILPTPRIVDLNALSEAIEMIGTNESGSVSLDEVSGRYTEDQLLGNNVDGSSPGPDEDVYYEVVFPLPSGTPIHRRFYPASAPHYSSGKFEWTIRLVRSNPDPSRDTFDP